MERSLVRYPSKQTKKVICSQEMQKMTYPPLVFSNLSVSHCYSKKHLGIILNPKLMFEEHYRTLLSKLNRTI